MTVELRVLTFSVVLSIVQIVASSHAASLQRAYRWTASGTSKRRRCGGGRAPLRVLRNFMETFPLFAAVVLAAHVSDTHGVLTVRGAYPYFWARVVYSWLYTAGIPLIRLLV